MGRRRVQNTESSSKIEEHSRFFQTAKTIAKSWQKQGQYSKRLMHLLSFCKQLIQPVPSNPCLWILGASLTTREHRDHIPDKTPPPQFHFGLVRMAVPTSQAIRSQMAKQPWLLNGTSSTPCCLGIIKRSRHTQTTACIAVRSLGL